MKMEITSSRCNCSCLLLFQMHQTGIFLIYGDLVSNISHLKLAGLMNLNC